MGDNHQAVVPRPELVLTVACDGLRPSPLGLNPLCVDEAAVNKPRPVPSSSFLPPSPLGPPPPLYSYRAATEAAVDAWQKVLSRIDSGFAVPQLGTDGRGARVIPARTPPRQAGGDTCISGTVVSEEDGGHV